MTHGEDSVTELFAGRLRDELSLDAYAPFSGTVYDLLNNCFIEQAQPIVVEKKPGTPKNTRAYQIFQKLVAAGDRLREVIRRNEGGANKDLDRFTREIQSLCDRWDRKDE